MKTEINLKFLFKRLLALFIDTTIACIVLFAVVIFLRNFNSIRGFPQIFIGVLFFSIIILLRDVNNKFSIGKRIYKLKVVSTEKNNSNISVYKLIIRNLPVLLYYILLGIIADRKNSENEFIYILYLLILMFMFFDIGYLFQDGVRLIDQYLKIEVIEEEKKELKK